MKNIGIIGLGYVGLTLGILSAEKGYNVYGVEISEEIVSKLNNNESFFYEPDIDELIKKHNKKNFNVVSKFTEEMNIEAFIVTVGTPLLEGEKKPNFNYLKSAIDTIKDVFSGKELIILRSTVSVGSTRNIIIPYLKEISGIDENEILAAFCPERTVEGKALKELVELPQIIGGNNQKSYEKACEFFNGITSNIIKMDSLEEAELIKLFNNTYRDINFAIGNIFNNIAQQFNIDGVKVINAANKDYKRSSIALPGLVGGPCLEKDVYILTNNIKESFGKQFVLEARKFNESLEDQITEWTEKINKEIKADKKVMISGLAFKGVPETSDLRGSNSVNIARKLKEKGYELTLHDFCTSYEDLEKLNLGNVEKDFYEALKGNKIVLILNNNKKYEDIDINILTDSERKVLDCWNKLKYENSDCIFNIGNFSVEGEK